MSWGVHITAAKPVPPCLSRSKWMMKHNYVKAWTRVLIGKHCYQLAGKKAEQSAHKPMKPDCGEGTRVG